MHYFCMINSDDERHFSWEARLFTMVSMLRAIGIDIGLVERQISGNSHIYQLFIDGVDERNAKKTMRRITKEIDRHGLGTGNCRFSFDDQGRPIDDGAGT